MPRALPRFRLPVLARARRCVAGRATGCGHRRKSGRGLRGRHGDVGETIWEERRRCLDVRGGNGARRLGFDHAACNRPGLRSRTGRASTTGSSTTGVEALNAKGAISSRGGSMTGAGIDVTVSALGAGSGGAAG